MKTFNDSWLQPATEIVLDHRNGITKFDIATGVESIRADIAAQSGGHSKQLKEMYALIRKILNDAFDMAAETSTVAVAPRAGAASRG